MAVKGLRKSFKVEEYLSRYLPYSDTLTHPMYLKREEVGVSVYSKNGGGKWLALLERGGGGILAKASHSSSSKDIGLTKTYKCIGKKGGMEMNTILSVSKS